MKRGGSSGDARHGDGGGKSARVRADDPQTGISLDRGISLGGLKHLATGSGDRSVRDMWRTVWIHQTVAEGWTVEAFFDEHDVFTHQVYTNLETKHQITMQRKDNGETYAIKKISDPQVDRLNMWPAKNLRPRPQILHLPLFVFGMSL